MFSLRAAANADDGSAPLLGHAGAGGSANGERKKNRGFALFGMGRDKTTRLVAQQMNGDNLVFNLHPTTMEEVGQAMRMHNVQLFTTSGGGDENALDPHMRLSEVDAAEGTLFAVHDATLPDNVLQGYQSARERARAARERAADLRRAVWAQRMRTVKRFVRENKMASLLMFVLFVWTFAISPLVYYRARDFNELGPMIGFDYMLDNYNSTKIHELFSKVGKNGISDAENIESTYELLRASTMWFPIWSVVSLGLYRVDCGCSPYLAQASCRTRCMAWIAEKLEWLVKNGPAFGALVFYILYLISFCATFEEYRQFFPRPWKSLMWLYAAISLFIYTATWFFPLMWISMRWCFRRMGEWWRRWGVLFGGD